ncbi:PepSY domain-containing protein [Solwaraspora sp. WMMD792]|uniref:PepSY domain-containing protein n=1 Tax=Solwaraspora sp. WMMD792 TaxID=3016099 RepID=UPI002415BBF3|nr:PepSY domain-containing protein [Solwaraspora sp. WMMD792]MDG4771881.1 PepSY domain-containing protein [Solwaraspora sp. WMMD792]
MASRPVIVMIGVGAVAALAVAGTALGAAAQDVTDGAGSPSPAVVASESGQQTTSVPRTGTDGAADDGPSGAAATGSGPADQVTLDRAARIAVDEVGGGRVTEIERDHTDGRPIWEVEVVADGVEWDLDIDRVTGDIVKVDRDDDDDDRWDDDDRDDDRRDR